MRTRRAESNVVNPPRIIRPEVSAEQVANFVKALAGGEPNRRRIAMTVFADRVREPS